MRFLKDGNVDFLVWVLLQDGLLAAPFNLHSKARGRLQEQGASEDLWFGWLEYVLNMKGKKVTRIVDSRELQPDFIPSKKIPYPTFERIALPYDFCANYAPLYYEMKRLYELYPGAKHTHTPMKYKQFDFLAEEAIPKVKVDLLFVDYPEFVWYKSKHGEVIVSIPLTSQEEQKERLFEITRSL